MKHFMYTCALALTTLLLFGSGKASAQAPYKIKSLRYFDTCKIQSVELERADTGIIFVETSYGDGTKDTANGRWLVTWLDHEYAAAGSYTVKVVLMDPGYNRLDSATVVATVAGCNSLWGRLYKDNNANCVFDAGDRYIYTPVSIEVDSAGTVVDTISAWGSFYYRAKASGKIYSFRVIDMPASLSLICPSGGVISGTSLFGSTSLVGDFGFTCASPAPSGFDVAVVANAFAGRGTALVTASLTSNSCLPKSGTIKLTMDPKYTVSTTYPSGGTVSGNTVTWNYSSLAMDSARYYYVYGTASPLLTIGDTVRFTVYAPPLVGETDTINNIRHMADTVRLSWDPNDKRVMPEGNIKAGQTLTYTLNFENMGNAPAQNIHVLDTLSSLVDPQSVRVLSATHKMNLYKNIDPASRRTILKFDFPNIMLKDSSHHGECTGSVTFSVKVRNGLPDGSLVTNRGGIYFDDNEVVLTNTTASLIATLAINDPQLLAKLAVYPNPVHDELQLKLDNLHGLSKMTILNTLGQVMLQQDILGTDTRINVRSLLPGVYFVLVQGEQGSSIAKIEKQ